ncbi:MAG: nuclear transport factor 2 family protein [Pseudomonadota bacterium]
MDELLRCERECTRLCQDFIYTIDRRQYEPFMALFAPEPTLDRAGQVFRGMDGLKQFCEGRAIDRYVRHLMGNIRIDMTGPATAKGTSSVTMFGARAEPDAALPLPSSHLVFAEYEDDYVLTGAGWKIKNRRIAIVFAPAG